MKKLIIAAGLLLSSCATVQPATRVVCEACQALTASGLCNLSTAKTVPLVKCPDGQEVVITNWNSFAQGKDKSFEYGCAKIKEVK